MPTVEVRGAKLYYTEAGQGPALLFVHGMCSDADVWRGQMARLSPAFHCVAYDRRGHTRSELGHIEQRTVELHADDAAALIKALDLAPCLLVGSSGGARIAIDVARRYPHLLAGVVLSEPPLFSLDRDGAQEFLREIKPRVERAMASGPRAAVDAFFSYVCPGLWSTLDDARKEPYRANHVELMGDLQMPLYQIGVRDLEQIAVPTLVLRGDSSLPVFRTVAGVLAAHIHSAELVELANSGHVTYAEQPEAFARAVRSFAQRIGARKTALAVAS